MTEAEEKFREFYNISDAYQMINALLMPGINNEIARIKDEKRKPNPDILDACYLVLFCTGKYGYSRQNGRIRTR